MTFYRIGACATSPRSRAIARAYAQCTAQALTVPVAVGDAPEREEMTAALAHELRNAVVPLRYGLATLRLAGPDSPNGQAAYELVERRVERLCALLDGMMDLYRAKGPLRPRVLDLEVAAGRAAEAADHLIQEGRHRLSIQVAPAARVVTADPLRLEQVLSNLLVNAAKYTAPSGEVELSANRDGSAVVIRVRDTGVGIPEELLTRVFDRFVQGDSRADGLGLGLTVVRRLVELHGGEVWAESAGVGRGSTFVVRLPQPPAAGSPQDSSNGEPP
jgi:signal transduction histidine kinase